VVRIRRLAAGVAFAALVGLAALLPVHGLHAQTLQHLTVQAFTLGSDVGRPQVGEAFHLVVTLRVRENVTQIDNLELPMLAELELLGDERALQSSSSGTLYRETITVVAHRAGAIAVAPAILQAIDARDRRAKQYYSNGLTLHVAGAPGQGFLAGVQTVSSIGRFALQLTIWILGGLCAAALIVLLFRRRPPPVAISMAPPPATVAVAEQPQRSPRDQLEDALTVLRAEPTRDSAVRVRAAVWAMVGASEGETLADVLQRPQAAPQGMRALLAALERAAFTYDDDLAPAVAGACDALQRYLVT
jgi:hypothetical protein